MPKKKSPQETRAWIKKSRKTIEEAKQLVEKYPNNLEAMELYQQALNIEKDVNRTERNLDMKESGAIQASKLLEPILEKQWDAPMKPRTYRKNPQRPHSQIEGTRTTSSKLKTSDGLTVEVFKVEPTPEALAQQLEKERARIEKDLREFRERHALRKAKKERIKNHIPLELGTVETNILFEYTFNPQDFKNIPFKIKSVKLQNDLVMDYPKDRHTETKPIGSHYELRWVAYDALGDRMTHNVWVETDEKGLPQKLVARMGDGELRSYNLNVKKIPKPIKALIKEAHSKTVQLKIDRQAQQIEALKTKESALQEELQRTKAGRNALRDYIHFQKHKKSRWNPFSR